MIVRYLTGDPEPMAEASAQVIDSDDSLYIPDVVIAETAYVLQSHYQVPREAVIDSLIALLQRDNVSPLHCSTEVTIEALLLCRDSGRVAVADALIWAAAHCSGRRVVYSLDGRFPDAGIEVRRRTA